MQTDNDRDLERRLRSVLRQELDHEHGPDPAWDESPAARRVSEREGRRPSRWTVRILAIAALITIGVGSAILFGSSDDQPALGSNGWIAYGMNPETGGDQDIWFVSLDGEPRRVIGTDTDVVDQFCPAFAPDGRSIAYGEADQSGATPNTAVVIGSVNSEGAVSEEFRVDVGEVPPCPVWSPDGDRIAFGVPQTSVINPERGAEGSQVWILTIADRGITVLPDLLATDLEFSPDSSLLAVASGTDAVATGNQLHDGRLYLFELASGATRTLEDTLGAVTFTWSPDGDRIAYEQIARDSGDSLRDLRVIDVATEEQRPLSTGRHATYGVLHGIGPVWSPDGESIVYQRCPTLGMCNGEDHDVVLVRPDDLSADGTPREEIIPLIERAADGSERDLKGPYWVTWSPDGGYLVFAAWSAEIDPLLGVVPAVPGSPSDLLVTDQDLTVNPVYDAGPFVPIQIWQRRPGDAATPTPTPSPSVAASLPEGPHVLLDGNDGVPVTVTIPSSGWYGEPNGGVMCGGNPADCAGPPDGAGIFAFASREYDVYSDACHWGSPVPVTPATTVDQLVDAMTGRSQQHRWGLPPEDITVDGYAGKRILVLMAQTIYWGSECTDGVWALFGVPGDDLVRSSQGKDQIEEVWALDVDGLIVVLVGAHYPETPEFAVDEMRAILASATFD